MNTQHFKNLLKKAAQYTPAPQSEDNDDFLFRRCLCCGRYFRAKERHYIHCSWSCTQRYKAQMAELDKLVLNYGGHPF